MDDSGEPRIPQRHVAELSAFFAAHDRWLFGHACVRTRGDRELAADLVQDTFEAAARAWATLRGHAEGRQRAWLLGTLANKDISDFRRKQAFRRRQPDIQARYQPAAADTAAQALSAIALQRAREIIGEADAILAERGIPVLPDVLTNAGGLSGRGAVVPVGTALIGHLHGLGHSMLGETELAGGGRRAYPGALVVRGTPGRGSSLSPSSPTVCAARWFTLEITESAILDDPAHAIDDRGGLLPMAVFLTQSSPGLRTSAVKRGYWVVRRVLGEATFIHVVRDQRADLIDDAIRRLLARVGVRPVALEQRGGGHERGEDRQVAVSQVDQPHHAEHQREPAGEQRVEPAGQDALDDGVDPCHNGSLPSAAAPLRPK